MVVRVPLAAVEILYEPARSAWEIEGKPARWTAEIASGHLELAYGLSGRDRMIGTGTSLASALERLVDLLYAELEAEGRLP